MKVIYKPITFDFSTVVEEEVPYLSTFYREGWQLNRDVSDLLAFPLNNKQAMPFYTIKEPATEKLNAQFEAYYQMMLDALKVALQDRELLDKYFDCTFWREHGDRFLPYAEYTFKKKHPALYGRYDACFDPETEQLVGVYEFNGDTPVMLFESVNLQARYSSELGTDQYNNYWDIFVEQMGKQSYRNVAVVVGTDYVEDMATADTLCQAFQAALPMANTALLDIKDLEFDHANIRKPFVASWNEDYLDAAFILSPWEEMVENFPKMLDHWERWADNVHLYEPAWRWFLAHKGMTALCTHLMDIDSDFYLKHYEASRVLLPTYVQDDFFKDFWYSKDRWVEKPVVGRLSNNIKIWHDGKLENDTGGFYKGEKTVFQKYTAPGKVEGRNNFILGMWMCGEHSATLCMREFDSEVLSISNERYIPHIVEEGV